jgi:hypothetical protein
LFDAVISNVEYREDPAFPTEHCGILINTFAACILTARFRTKRTASRGGILRATFPDKYRLGVRNNSAGRYMDYGDVVTVIFGLLALLGFTLLVIFAFTFSEGKAAHPIYRKKKTLPAPDADH